MRYFNATPIDGVWRNGGCAALEGGSTTGMVAGYSGSPYLDRVLRQVSVSPTALTGVGERRSRQRYVLTPLTLLTHLAKKILSENWRVTGSPFLAVPCLQMTRGHWGAVWPTKESGVHTAFNPHRWREKGQTSTLSQYFSKLSCYELRPSKILPSSTPKCELLLP